MKRLIVFLSTISFFAAIASCTPEENANHAPSVTVGTEHISAISVVLKGKANLGATTASDLSIGFQYSTSAGIMPSNSTTVEAVDADANYNYTAGITGLEPETTYYYRSFVRQNGQDTYGETKSFTTKEVASMLETKDASAVDAKSDILNAKLDLTVVKYSSMTYGFCWGTSESSQNTKLEGDEIKGNAYSATLTNLSYKTQYWYKAYVTLDSQTFYGEVKTFTTGAYTAVAGDAVNLGLSVKWSSMNLGATSPYGVGYYFAWGETSPKTDFNMSNDNWSTYELCNGSSTTLTKYNNNSSYGIVDDKTEFIDYNYEDDAARQALGGKWRIPTDAEWKELLTKCTWSIEQITVNGRRVTGPNGNSIFFPDGFYWSSSIDTDHSFAAWGVHFYYDDVCLNSLVRYYGLSVRPVSE